MLTQIKPLTQEERQLASAPTSAKSYWHSRQTSVQRLETLPLDATVEWPSPVGQPPLVHRCALPVPVFTRLLRSVDACVILPSLQFNAFSHYFLGTTSALLRRQI
jgi:hypothetical protein